MWRSKADVLNDLAEYSTFGTDFDDSDIVRGMGPPRTRHNEDIDDEMKIRFGDKCSRSPTSSLSQRNTPGPDLRAITEALRMVDTFDKPEEKQPAQSEVCGNTGTIVVISKLNPDIPEFIPVTKSNYKSVEIMHSQTQTTTAVNNNKTKVTSPVCSKEKVTEKQDNTHEEIEHSNEEDLHLKLLENQLKNKITSMSKPKTFEQKRQRNVAIANLMRLMTGASTPKSSTSTLSKSPQSKQESPLTTDCHADLIPSKPVELLTPEYFTGPSCSPKVMDIHDNELMIPEPLLERLKTTPSPKERLDPQITESIEKVNKWLNPEVKTKLSPAAPHSGTVLFRKKGPTSTTPKSPCSVVSKKSEQESVPSPPEEYVPSADAKKIKEQYEERVKAKEELIRKNQPPPDKLKPLKDIGISFTFSGRDCDSRHEL